MTPLQVAEPGEVDLMALKGRLNELGKDPALAECIFGRLQLLVWCRSFRCRCGGSLWFQAGDGLRSRAGIPRSGA